MVDDRFAATIAAPPASEAAASITPPAAGAPVVGGRYEILGMLGAGGMGNVYRARDRELEEVVALKMLRPELVGAPGVLDRFRREVKLARRVTHANVARVFDIGEAGGEKFLTMELVEGESLAALLSRERALPVGRVVAVAEAICGGLAAAHAAGVIHRDLKPDNVLVARDGRVVVTDFGIAHAAFASDSRTVSGFIGTPAYMAPEQVEATGEIGAGADLYALGAMLYELCTGELPWQGTSALGVAAARLLRPPPDPRALRPDLPAALGELILRCMARDPADRPRSAVEVATLLSRVTLPAIDDAPYSARAAPVVAPPAAAAKRVAVLPFRNTGAPEHDYLADGLTEDLLDLLSVSPGLRVRSRGVVMRYKGADRDPREIGRELDVQVVIEGSVRRAGGLLRVSARLISVADGFQLWARRFDRPEAEILAVSDDAASAIAEALTVEIAAPARAVAVDPEVTDLYLRARASYHRFFNDLAGKSIGLFEEALARAPDDPRVLSGYAMARARVWNGDPRDSERALAAAERAVRLAPHLAEPHLALGSVRFQSGDEVGAVQPLRRAIRLVPTCGGAHDLLGRILGETPLQEDARRHLEAAIALDPDHDIPFLSLCRLYELSGERDRVDAMVEARGDWISSAPVLGRLLIWRRDAARARSILESAGENAFPIHVIRALYEVAAYGKDPFHAFPPYRVSDQMTLRARSFFLQVEAECASALGDLERTLRVVEEASQWVLFDVCWLDRCPLLEPIRADPRFLAARARVEERALRVVLAYQSPER